MFTKRSFYALVVVLIAVSVFQTPVRADSIITVTTTDDNTTDDTFCSLREAIANADANGTAFDDCTAGSGNDTILFADALGIATLVLGSTLPTITDSAGLTINGGGDVSISGNDLYRIFLVFGNITLNNLTVTHGACASCNGGGIYNSGGTVTITNSTLSNHGGGIYSYEGELIITNSTLSNNSATYGGAINIVSSTGSESTATITDSTFSNNSSAAGGGGASIYNYGDITITGSTFTDNTSGSGNIYNNGTLSITNSTFSGNSATNSGGGGIYNNGTLLSITNSTFSGNSATNNSYGGGILNFTPLVITNSTFSGNSAAESGGGIYNYNNATLTVTNSTFSENSAISGGGIYNYNNATLTVTNSTFSENTALAGSGIFNNDTGSLHLQNTILANGIDSEDCYNVSGDIIATNTNNLIETNGASGHMCGTPTLTADPMLGVLADNGGFNLTFALLAGSPAIDAGDDDVCAAAPVNNESQNGVARPQGSHCEIGAFEKMVVFNLFLPLILR